MSDQQSESVGELDIELPPALVAFVDELKKEQKKLLKDKAYDSPNQLKKFVATSLMERFIQMVEMLGTQAYDQHNLGVSNAIQLQKMRRWTAEHLRALGRDVNDGDPFANVGTKQIDGIAQALYALGSYIQAKYGGDKEVEVRFNQVQMEFNELVETLMGNQAFDEDGDEDENEEDEPAVDEPAVDEPAGEEEAPEADA